MDVPASAVLQELPDSTAVMTVTANYNDLSSVSGGWTAYCGTYGGVTVDVPRDKQSPDFDGCEDGALWFDNAGQAHYCCSGGGTQDLFRTNVGGVAYKAYRVSIRPVGSGESTPYVAHVHNYVYSIMDPATDNSDATYVYRCSCGDMKEWGIIPNTGFYTFNDNTAKDIRLANSGAVVKVDTGVWDTFHFMVINEFAKKGNVSLDITYKVSGEVHKFIIPAGADLTPALSSEGYANFRVLEAMFAQ